MYYSGCCCCFRLWFSFFLSRIWFFAVVFFLIFSFCVFQKVQLPAQLFMVVFHNFFGCFFVWGEGIFMATFFAVFFFHSLWRFDEFLLSLPYMALYGLSSMCYICKTSNIWVDNAQSSGLFLILKAINYFLCFCFVFSFGSVRGGRSRWTRAVHVMVDQV